MAEDDEKNDETNRRIDRLSDIVNARLERLEDGQLETNRRLDAMDAKLGSMDVKLGSMDVKLGGMDAKLGGMDAKLGGMDAKLADVARGTNLIVERLDRLVEATIRGNTATTERYADHEVRLRRLEQRMDDFENRPES